jgi:hypothetical protein
MNGSGVRSIVLSDDQSAASLVFGSCCLALFFVVVAVLQAFGFAFVLF